MGKLKVGDRAPDFKLVANNGRIVSLGDYHRQKNIVLYFYPKDDTPGCTIEACGFRDTIQDMHKADTVILGVSPDDLSSHQKFVGKFSLPFLLLSDENKKVCKAYGVWVEKSMYGRKYMGVARTTFVIDRQGKIFQIFEKVKPQGHEAEVLESLQSLV